ncbi:MAG TPA: hypothetical protein ENH62_08180 [Marinobacter sp.]|uniref:Uncharacterized protein n=1 Tax=marine sediment metagenome TaxID=412755 RepID=A0A0F9IZ92_9ZZZZ|nr:hypothetical protein [Marinobacter sp.]
MDPATLTAPDASPVHPLADLGFVAPDPNEGAALLRQIGSLPGAAEAQREAELIAAAQFAQSQGVMTSVQPNPAAAPGSAAPGTPDTAAQFNRTFAEQALADQQAANSVVAAQGVAPGAVTPEGVTITQDDYDFLVGIISDQGAALQGYIGGQVAVPGPPAVGNAPMVAPGAAPAPRPDMAAPAVAPIAVPTVAETDISEAEFEKMTTDRSAMSKYLHNRDMKMAATVTEHLSGTILPHIYSHMRGQMDEQATINTFLQSNPDLADHPDALTAAVAEARLALPYAKADRLMYYAGQKLRGAMRANDNINTSLHDLRGPGMGRRAPVINNAMPVRRGPGNTPVMNPFTVMKTEMLAHNAGNDGDILKNLGIR